MIVIGGHVTTGGFKDYAWVIVPANSVDYISNDPCYERIDRNHKYRESQWSWAFRNWKAVRVEEQEGA